MTIFTKVPTHIDYAYQMAKVAAEMAGYDLTELENRAIDRDSAKSALYRRFVDKGLEAIAVLGPALVRPNEPPTQRDPRLPFSGPHSTRSVPVRFPPVLRAVPWAWLPGAWGWFQS